jgi:hypothetical protein
VESGKSRAAIEPKTGTLAHLTHERVTVTVRPDPKALAPLVAILNRHEAIAVRRVRVVGVQPDRLPLDDIEPEREPVRAGDPSVSAKA